jgi:3-hydroxyacyl-[acyl-carrier-protein] dehydratase
MEVSLSDAIDNLKPSRRARPMPLFGWDLPDCEILAVSADNFRGRFTVLETAQIFAGHYPGRPILPGVYLLEAGLQAMDLAMEDCPRLVSIERFRLLHAVMPGCLVTVQATRLSPAESGSRANWKHEVFLDEVLAARFRFIVDAAPQVIDADDLCDTAENAPASFEMHTADILRRLPHRWPILLVDAATVAPAERRITTRKAVSCDEPCYADLQSCGQRSARAYPPSLILESFTQSAALLMIEVLEGQTPESCLMVFGGVLGAEFHHEVFPGDVMSHKVLELAHYGRYALASGMTLVGNKKVATFEGLSVALLN